MPYGYGMKRYNDFGTSNMAQWVQPAFLQRWQNEDNKKRIATANAIESLQKSADTGSFTAYEPFNNGEKQGTRITSQGSQAYELGGDAMMDALEKTSASNREKSQAYLDNLKFDNSIKMLQIGNSMLEKAEKYKKNQGAKQFFGNLAQEYYTKAGVSGFKLDRLMEPNQARDAAKQDQLNLFMKIFDSAKGDPKPSNITQAIRAARAFEHEWGEDFSSEIKILENLGSESVKVPNRGTSEIKLDNLIETSLAGRYPGFIDDPAVRSKAYKDYASNPKLRAEVNVSAASMAQGRVAPTYNIIQTPTGYSAVNVRNPQLVKDLGIARPLSQKEADDISTLDTVRQSIAKAKTLYNPAYVGPVAGRKGAVTGTVGVGTSTEEQTFRAANAELEKTLFDLGGKQLTANEIKVLKPFIPSTKDPAVTYEAKLKNFEAKYNDILNKKVESLNRIGFKAEGGKMSEYISKNQTSILGEAKSAIGQGADKEKVKARLKAMGFSNKQMQGL